MPQDIISYLLVVKDGNYNIHGDATVLNSGCLHQDGCGAPLEHREV